MGRLGGAHKKMVNMFICFFLSSSQNRESTNPRFRNPRFLFGVCFLHLGQKKIGKNPKTKTPP